MILTRTRSDCPLRSTTTNVEYPSPGEGTSRTRRRTPVRTGLSFGHDDERRLTSPQL